ncbi:MAG: glycosyltransferase family 2 protein [Pseudomonadota bacterium]
MDKIAVVVPVYGSPDSLEELVDEIKSVMTDLGVSFECILVDDSCPKGSWTVIQTLSGRHPEVTGVRLSRNFGQHPAIYAGLAHTNADWVVVMDCDLQDHPREIAKLYETALLGYDVVRARRVSRRDTWYRRSVSWLFYRVLSFMTGVEHSAEVANFGIYRTSVIDAILSWNEDHRYFPAGIQWIGFQREDIEIEHRERKHGKTSYNFSKLVDLALSIVLSFSDKPLKIIATFGVVVAMLSFVLSGVYLTIALLGGFAVPGWASIVVSLWFLAGVILFSIGVTGLYVGQAMREAKGRPNYVVAKVIGAQNADQSKTNRIKARTVS